MWYIIWIVSSSPTDFHSEKRVNKGHLWPPLLVLGLIKILSDSYSSVITHWNCQLKLYIFPLRKYRVNQGHNLPPLLEVLGLRNVFIIISQSVRPCQLDFVYQTFPVIVSQTFSFNQSDFFRYSVRCCQSISQSVSQSYSFSYFVKLFFLSLLLPSSLYVSKSLT